MVNQEILLVGVLLAIAGIAGVIVSLRWRRKQSPENIYKSTRGSLTKCPLVATTACRDHPGTPACKLDGRCCTWAAPGVRRNWRECRRYQAFEVVAGEEIRFNIRSGKSKEATDSIEVLLMILIIIFAAGGIIGILTGYSYGLQRGSDVAGFNGYLIGHEDGLRTGRNVSAYMATYNITDPTAKCEDLAVYGQNDVIRCQNLERGVPQI